MLHKRKLNDARRAEKINKSKIILIRKRRKQIDLIYFG